MPKQPKAPVCEREVLLPIPIDGSGFIFRIAKTNKVRLMKHGDNICLAVVPAKGQCVLPVEHENDEVLWSNVGLPAGNDYEPFDPTSL